MTRTLTAGMQTAVAAQTGTIIYLFQIESDAGTTRFTTAPVDIAWDSQTWSGIGGTLAFPGVEETADPSGQGVELTLSGVDQTIIAVILNNQVRGREVRIWLAHLSDAGAVVADPLEIFRGYQLSDYRITETRSREGGTVEVRTRVQSRLSKLRQATAVRTNDNSLNDMLKRLGLATGNTFFSTVPAIADRYVRWGPFQIGTRRAKRRGT